jgi:hypothetical protein
LIGIVGVVYSVGMTAWGYRSLVPIYAVLVTGGLVWILRLGTKRAARRSTRTLVLALAVWSAATAVTAQPRDTSCTTCHSDQDLFDAEALQIIQDFRIDVHAEVGLSCHDCHGGNPALAAADDFATAMDESFGLNPYLGAPSRGDMPAFCGRCHSSPSYMKRFIWLDAPVDQEREYWTSRHGQMLAEGDTNVATCDDCHGVHGIRRSDDPQSPVYPTRVAATCSGCHSSPERMAGYTRADGRPFPIDQKARWQSSVHATAMHERGDLSAPTCNDCHGNHGAAPPGVDSVAVVCGQCHGRESELFRGSPKHAGFERHNEYLTEVGEEGCGGCHEPPEPQVWVTGIRQFGECTSCHDNHGTVRPTVAMFGVLPDHACAFCHENPGIIEREAAEPEASERSYAELLDRLLIEASAANLEGEELFDWTVDQAHHLPQHSYRGEEGEEGQAALRPEFSRLFEKFRIGKTYFTYPDAQTGEEVRAQIIRCNSCHVTGAMGSDTTPGAVTGIDLVDRMSELTALTARAERILLRAHRGGVEIRDALIEVDQAVDSQIALEVQVHGFTAEEGSDFLQTYERGLEHARAAIEEGLAAEEEIQSRRRWLAISLIAIVAVLIGLGLKIRELSAGEQRIAST